MSKTFTIAITGTPDFQGLYEDIENKLNFIIQAYIPYKFKTQNKEQIRIITGDSLPIEEMVVEYAAKNDIHCSIIKENRSLYKKNATNIQLEHLAFVSDFAVLFWDMYDDRTIDLYWKLHALDKQSYIYLNLN